MFKSLPFRSMILVASLAASASAQDSTIVAKLARRSSGSLSFIQSRPQGDLRQNLGLAYGLSGAYLLRLDAAGVWSIRADLGVVSYGAESGQSALTTTLGGPTKFNVSTNHYVIPMSVGPQLMWPTGTLRPYVNAGIGAQVYETSTYATAVGDPSLTVIADRSEFAPSWVAGGGLYMPVYDGKAKVALDFGLQYLNGGSVPYQARGGMIDPATQIQINASRSATHMLILRFGTKIGL